LRGATATSDCDHRRAQVRGVRVALTRTRVDACFGVAFRFRVCGLRCRVYRDCDHRRAQVRLEQVMVRRARVDAGERAPREEHCQLRLHYVQFLLQAGSVCERERECVRESVSARVCVSERERVCERVCECESERVRE